MADGIAECQVRFPTVPILFCDTRRLAQEWTYRFLAAARVAPPKPADVRLWASKNSIAVSDRGRIPAAVMDQYLAARASGET